MIHCTRDGLRHVEWVEITPEEWDRVSEHRREILMLPGKGCVFVKERDT